MSRISHGQFSIDVNNNLISVVLFFWSLLILSVITNPAVLIIAPRRRANGKNIQVVT